LKFLTAVRFRDVPRHHVKLCGDRSFIVAKSCERILCTACAEKSIHGKNGNGRNVNRKIKQLEKSATKNERVGKKGNTKLMCEITATEKKATEKTATGKWATENWTTRKFGNEN